VASIADAERAQQRLREKFGRMPGVRGIGVAWDERGDTHISVNVDNDLRETVRNAIPNQVDGVPIELRSIRNLRTFAG
jgi:hypothetical protein